MSLSAQISPSSPSLLASFDVDLLCLKLGDTTICLSYGNKTIVQGYEQVWENYTGLYIHYQYNGPGAFLPQSCAVTGSLANNVWNSVTLSWSNRPQIAVTIGGQTTTPCTIGMEQDTAGLFRAGLETSYGVDWAVYYDNIVATARR
ncbi:MAG TPA: hypothetical protein VJV78_49615 [Polyangiales bacterium]|nr:hypothetical protein [Polyangiales bacterium]